MSILESFRNVLSIKYLVEYLSSVMKARDQRICQELMASTVFLILRPLKTVLLKFP